MTSGGYNFKFYPLPHQVGKTQQSASSILLFRIYSDNA